MPFRRAEPAAFVRALALAAALVSAAGQAAAERDLWHLAPLAASERLRIFAAGDRLASGEATGPELESLRAALVRQGFYGPGIVEAGGSVAPYLAYDSNINGGVTQDRFTVGGLVFEATPESQAVAGLVVGATAGAAMRYAWAEGRVLEARARGIGGVAPTERLGYGALEGQLCALTQVSGWTFADLCLGGVVQDRDLGRSEVWRQSLGLTTLFDSAVGAHDLTAEVAIVDGQAQGSLRLETVLPRFVTDVSLTAGVPVDGETALKARLSGGLSWVWDGAPASVRMWYEVRDGGAFLGRPREDRTTGLTLARRIGPGVSAEVRWARTESTADLYDDESLSVNVSFAGFGR